MRQHRHSLPSAAELPAAKPQGRLIDTQLADWTLYNIEGGERPLAIAAEGGSLELSSHESIGVFWHSLDVNTSRHPILSWQWRVSRVYEDSSPLGSQADNFPARVLIGFDASWDDADAVALSFKRKVEDITGESPPSRAIVYTFGGSLPSNEAVDGSFGSGRVAVINLRNVRSSTGKWYRQTRDLQRDYEAVFRRPAPAVSMMGLACDTHLVGGEAKAWFREFTLYPASARSGLVAEPEPEALGPSKWRVVYFAVSVLFAACIGVCWIRGRSSV